MSQIALSAETEEIIDRPNFSLLSIIALFLSLIGCFSLRYLQAMPFAVLGGGLGAVCLLTAKRQQLGLGSKFLGTVATALGITIASSGYFNRQLALEADVAQAKRVASEYFEAVRKGDMDRVYLLHGLDLVRDVKSEKPEMKETIGGINGNPFILDIKRRKDPPQWEYASLAGYFNSEGVQVYRLHYRDASQPKKPSCCVTVRKITTKPNPENKPITWLVDKLGELELK